MRSYPKEEHIAGHALDGHDEGVREGEPVSLLVRLDLMGKGGEGRVLLQFPQGLEGAIIVVDELGVVAQVLALPG
jgi:hypothetical protein